MSSEEPVLLSEGELDGVRRKLRRVAVGSLSLVVLLVVILLAVVDRWAGVPLVVRVTFPAILLWSLVVAVYAFDSYRRAWANRKGRLPPEKTVDPEGSDDATEAGSADAAD